MTDSDEIKTAIEDATFDFTMGDSDLAVSKLESLLESAPESFGGWHALCEVHYSEKRYSEALAAAEKAHALKPDDLFINTSLSRIWLELGSKEKAEHFGALAKIAGWKEELKNPGAAETQGDLSST